MKVSLILAAAIVLAAQSADAARLRPPSGFHFPNGESVTDKNWRCQLIAQPDGTYVQHCAGYDVYGRVTYLGNGAADLDGIDSVSDQILLSDRP